MVNYVLLLLYHPLLYMIKAQDSSDFLTFIVGLGCFCGIWTMLIDFMSKRR